MKKIILFPRSIWRRLKFALALSFLRLISEDCFSAIEKTIRVKKFPNHDFSDDAKIDEIVKLATRGLCGIAQNGESSDEVKSIIEDFSAQATILELVKLRSFALVEMDRLERLGYQFYQVTEPVDKSVNGARAIFKSLRYASSIERVARRAIETKKAPKFDLSGSDITQAVTLFSVSLVTGGFFYEVIFFNRLGIDITRYLSVSDYLSASIGVISPAAVSVGITAAIIFYDAVSFSKSSKVVQQARLKTSTRFTWAIRIIIIIGAPIEWFVRKQFPFDALPLAAWLLAITFVPDWTSMYFKRPLFVSFIILFAVYFSAKIYSMAEINAISVRNGSYFKGDGDRVNLDESLKDLNQNDQLRLLETTPNFSFLYDTKKHKVWIFPREKVKAIYGAPL
ncbi:hypothetical protein AB4Y38_39255 [Paraburkholderia sp. EG285A]|uniref:hypothetical protein n=1 Tax=Paraburkholderia sp. EG285A TaxID=3237009 RepID=UPI0034D316E1